MGGQDPYLAHLNSIIEVLGLYRHEITAFLGNTAAAVQGALDLNETGAPARMLRTTSPLNPESIASFDQRLTSNRANPYVEPLGYNRLADGLESFANTPCDAGITATLPDRARQALGPPPPPAPGPPSPPPPPPRPIAPFCPLVPLAGW